MIKITTKIELKGVVTRNAFELNIVNRIFYAGYMVKQHLHGIYLKEFQFSTTQFLKYQDLKIVFLNCICHKERFSSLVILKTTW